MKYFVDNKVMFVIVLYVILFVFYVISNFTIDLLLDGKWKSVAELLSNCFIVAVGIILIAVIIYNNIHGKSIDSLDGIPESKCSDFPFINKNIKRYYTCFAIHVLITLLLVVSLILFDKMDYFDIIATSYISFGWIFVFPLCLKYIANRVR